MCVCVCLSLSPTFFFVSTESSGLKKSEKECGSTTKEAKSPRAACPRTTTPNSNNNRSDTTNNVASPHYDRHPRSGTRADRGWGPGSRAPTGRWDRPPAAPGWPTSYITVRLCTKGIIANSLILIIIIIIH
jgi:hypothetical protein